MRLRITKKTIAFTLLAFALIAGCLVLFAFARTWNKTDIEFKLHINEQLVLESVFGESPTFAIWLEDPETKWICWIEVNLAGDFNDTYKEYDEVAQVSDEYKTGQPALLYKAELTAEEGNQVVPDVAGMCILVPEKGVMIQPLKGITTATGIFDEINIMVVRPKPRIIEW
jgi:hypothetical protein